MTLYAGIDLHSTNNYLGVIDEQDRRLYEKRLPNDLDTILLALAPFKNDIEGVVVESTFNWYWLVDGLQDDGYKIHLANPSAIKQYEGLKHTDDRWDAFWLAHLLRLNILPEGYIYPKDGRPVRDLLRRRLLFVKHRTAHILSLQSTFLSLYLALQSSYQFSYVDSYRAQVFLHIVYSPASSLGQKASATSTSAISPQVVSPTLTEV